MPANPTSPPFTIASRTDFGPRNAVVTTWASQAALVPMSIEATLVV